MAKTESKTRNPRRVGCVVTAEPRRRGLLRFKERDLARAIGPCVKLVSSRASSRSPKMVP